MLKNNFRPISNLVFVGKLIEHIVADQIISYIYQHNLMEEKQSAYRKFHSTETAPLEVKSRHHKSNGQPKKLHALYSLTFQQLLIPLITLSS